MRRRPSISFSLTMWTVLVLLLLATTLLMLQMNAEPRAAAGSETKISNFNFAPATLKVRAGTTVTWTTRDYAPHGAISDNSSLKSRAMESDDKIVYTFRKAEAFSYSTFIYPAMAGKVVVQ